MNMLLMTVLLIHGNADFLMHTPFTRPQINVNPWLEEYNRQLSKHKRLIERVIGILKQHFKILSKPFRWERELFPLVFRVCLLQHNDDQILWWLI